MKGRKPKTNGDILDELIKRQMPNVPLEWRLQVNDMKRICKYIDKSIFEGEECNPWLGYITNMNNLNKGTYVNFYFKNKKVALHRLLYINYVGPLDSSEYLKFRCESKGICCNIKHYEKYKYSKTSTPSRKQNVKESKKSLNTIVLIDPDSDDDLTINFDM